MRIYQINIEHNRVGLNWRSIKVSAPNADKALAKAKKSFENFERLESLELLATDEN